MGNAFLQLNRNEKAVEAYELAIATYPKGDKLAEAYYRKGIAHTNLRQYEQARGAFEAVIKSYKDSGEATLARQKLDGLPPVAPAKR